MSGKTRVRDILGSAALQTPFEKIIYKKKKKKNNNNLGFLRGPFCIWKCPGEIRDRRWNVWGSAGLALISRT